jgi:hypothetical protein
MWPRSHFGAGLSPEISCFPVRFSGFTSSWVQDCIGAFGDGLNSSSPRKKNFQKQKNPANQIGSRDVYTNNSQRSGRDTPSVY